MSRVPISSRKQDALRFTTGASFNEASCSTAPTVASAATSESFKLGGFSSITFWVQFTYVAATQLQFYLEYSIDGGTTWSRKQGSDSAITLSVFEETLYPHRVLKDVAASGNFPVEIDVNAPLGRLVITSTGGTTDTVTVTPQLHIK